MRTENISTLKINKLTQEQYDRAVEAGNIEETALYFTPDDFNEEEFKKSITDEYVAEINEAKGELQTKINATDDKAKDNTEAINGLSGSITVINTSINSILNEISRIDAELSGKTDEEMIIPWANYDEVNNTVEIGINGSSYFIKSSETGLEIYNNGTLITNWNASELQAIKINASESITVNGLTLRGDNSNGWSFI